MEEEQIKGRTVSTVVEISKQGTEAPAPSRDAREVSDRRMRWIWAEPSIWTNAMLAALENGVKGGKWFSLIDKLCKPVTLRNAWQKVKANKGAAGIDEIDIENFERWCITYLEELEIELRNGTYMPQAVRRVYIPKGGGKLRPLGIPTIKDRVAQQAVKMAIEPILEKEFLDVSYGFRPMRGAKDALKQVSNLIEMGYTYVVDADLQSYFDTIPHERMMDKIEKYISDGSILSLVNKWLKQGCMEDGKEWTPIQGTPQGGVLSPILANLYLHDLDQHVTQFGYKMVRYADDFVILTKSREEANAALKLVQEWVKENGLTIHPEKTHVGNCMIEGEGFEFLGYRFEAGKRWVRNKSSQKFRGKIKGMTKRTCGQSIEVLIKRLNPVLRGWSNYFKHVTKYTLGTFDGFVRRRLRSILLRQNKRGGFGAGYSNMRWPNKFFAEKGLFTMETNQDPYFACLSRCGNY